MSKYPFDVVVVFFYGILGKFVYKNRRFPIRYSVDVEHFRYSYCIDTIKIDKFVFDVNFPDEITRLRLCIFFSLCRVYPRGCNNGQIDFTWMKKKSLVDFVVDWFKVLRRAIVDCWGIDMTHNHNEYWMQLFDKSNVNSWLVAVTRKRIELLERDAFSSSN